MLIYFGLDDTDHIDSDRGTGKLARWFKPKIPKGANLVGIVRQQLPRMEGIPFTSKNSSACVILESDSSRVIPELIEAGVNHVREHFIEGSDPGICVAADDQVSGLVGLLEFGRTCCRRLVTQKEAMEASTGFHLSGHGGTNDGIIGAAAAVGLTAHGWCGRYIDFEGLRNVDNRTSVGELESLGMVILPLERDALVAGVEDAVEIDGKLRPKMWGGTPAVPVISTGPNHWRAIGGKGTLLRQEQLPPAGHS